VTLVVDDGTRLAATTQHVAVGGDPMEAPVLALSAPDEPSYHPRPLRALDVYGRPVPFVPHTLAFLARPSRPAPDAKVIHLENIGGSRLAAAVPPEIDCRDGSGWLQVMRQSDDGRQSLRVSVDAAGLARGDYAASVRVSCPGAANSPQTFRVALCVAADPPRREAVVDDRDAGFYATPYFWVGHRFCRAPAEKRGYGGFYLTSGGRAIPGESARFTPDLEAGRYEVSLSDRTPFAAGAEFDVRVRHAGGDRRVRVRPEASRLIGRFDFQEGTDGFVEILAGGSRGLVVADAVVFRRLPDQ